MDTEVIHVLEMVMTNSRREIPDARRQLGVRIKRRRIDLDMSQQQVANKLSLLMGEPVQRSTYAHYETGYAAIDAITLQALADVLKCSASELLGDMMRPGKQMADPISVYFNNLPERLKPVATATLKAMSEQAEREDVTD